MNKQYSHYSAEELAADPSFESWVNHPDAEANQFWEAWIAKHPDKEPVVEKARQLVLLMSFESKILEEDQAEELLNRITRTIHQEQPAFIPKVAMAKKFYFPANLMRMAATLAGILLIAGALFYFLKSDKQPLYTTGYKQTRTITLPDGSVVTLNANSRLQLSGNWQEEADREVKLQGEAFFSVVHTRNHRKFIVVTSDHSSLEVLGTEFNVNNRRGHTRVVLSSGKVKLNLEKNKQVKNVTMQPGQLLEISKEKEIIANRQVKPEYYTAWQKNMLVFDDAPLWQIAQTLEDTYGMKVEIADQTLAKRKYTGSAPADQIQVLLTKISKIFDIRVIRKRDTILLETYEK